MIFLLNGPPGSGKDEACLFYEKLGFKHLSFKFQLYSATIEYFGVDKKWFFDGYTREEKDIPSLLLDGHSRRSALILVSEKIYKPIYGEDIWGNQLASNIFGQENICVSDLGFETEIHPVINKVEAGSAIIIQLTRDGCNFMTDSRRYLKGLLEEEIVLGNPTQIDSQFILPNELPIRVYCIHNNGTLDDFRHALGSIYEKEQNAQNKRPQESISRKSIRS